MNVATDVPARTDACRIAHVVVPAAFGGLETVVRTLAAGQMSRGHDVRVLSVLDQGSERDHPFVESLAAAGLQVDVVPVASRAYATERAAISRCLRENGVQVLHTHGYRADVVDGPVAHRVSIPHVATVHGFIGGDLKGRFYQWIQRHTLRRADAVVAVSTPILERLAGAGVSRNRLVLLRNAFQRKAGSLSRTEARRRLKCDAASYVVGWVGRLTSEKGADVLLDAVARLGHLPLQVAIVGDGRDRTDLEDRARRLGIKPRVIWCGTVPDAWRLFHALDVYVLSSRTEGTPIALLEAMSARIPIIATAVGGVPDVVGPGEALLVRPEDPLSLADAIEHVYGHRRDAEARAEAASRVLRSDFDVQQWVAAYDRVYARVLGRPPGTV